jgi:hypothetical protein
MTEQEGELTLDEYQEASALTDLEIAGNDPMVPLLGLGGEIGALQAEFKKKQRPDGVSYTGFDDVVVEELGDILWYLAALARRVNVSLSSVAVANLEKTRARWLPSTGGAPTSYDDGFPEEEKLPRQFTVVFETVESARGEIVHMRISGETFGDPIDDNARYSDHYRYHDAFHLAYAAVLGWSPVFRSLIGRKRRTDESTDRVEDGARAYATEEAVAALVFELSKAYGHFERAEHVDELILRAVKAVTARLEVGNRSAADWERAILVGFKIWRVLRDDHGGVVNVDLDAGSLELQTDR